MAKQAETQNPIWGVCVVIGVAVLALGFAWPFIGGGPSDEAKQDAAEFLEASQAMESAVATRNKAERAAKMAEVRERYRAARTVAEEARASSGKLELIMKAVGCLLAAVGCLGYYATRT